MGDNDATEANDLIMGAGGAPTAKFLEIGTTHVGQVTEIKRAQQTDLEGNPVFWPNGDPKYLAVITVQTDERDPEIDDDDGTRRLFVKGNMLSAVKDAVNAAGAGGVEVGGTLAVRYDRDGARKQAGFNPPKLYVAQYRAPAGDTADLFATAPSSGNTDVPSAMGGSPPPVAQSAADLF